ncbi:MAG: adenylosuccinate synthase [Candidatus Marinimicrobia bacterium]|nr:adenylosuccinate synthase [Candidatus Neomarinimicrobiota bacterium]
MSNKQQRTQITVIVGTQWGDEGKGKITDFFAGDVDYVIRYQGGDNAGHTLKVNDEVYKLHLVPSGVLYEKPISVIGCGVVINPQTLIEEISGLKERGKSPRLMVSERAHVIMPYHIAMDEALTGHQGKLAAGSTKRGIAPVYADKMYRHGIRMGDLLEPAIFEEKLTRAYQFNKEIIEKVFNLRYELSLEDIYTEYLSYGDQLKGYITDTELILYRAYDEGKTLLMEGAQGMSLDVDHGLYPHTTSSNTNAGQIFSGAGVGFHGDRRIIGVVKAYLTRVGISPFPSEILGKEADLLREKGNEYGTTTGRPRRVGHLDLVQVQQAIRVSGITELALTKVDVLSGFKKLQVCTSYDIDGETVTEMPGSLGKIRRAKPEYTTLDGWEEIGETQIKNFCGGGFDSLPSAMKDYILFIETEVNCLVTIISLGPERNQTILR